ncbi:tetratricopeptide repeat protein [Streptomyces sp. SID7803]|nr:tetratricopeptide repeat protein [Streptomyces sp. SID7803]
MPTSPPHSNSTPHLPGTQQPRPSPPASRPVRPSRQRLQRRTRTRPPTDAWTLAQRAETHRQADRYDQAVTDFTAALELDPTNAWTLGSRGEAHREAGWYDRAVTDFTAALELNPPTNAWTLGSRGQAHQQAGRYDQAVTDLTAALELNPPHSPGYRFPRSGPPASRPL